MQKNLILQKIKWHFYWGKATELKNLMAKLTQIFLLITVAVIFYSCGSEKPLRGYRFSEDGLIYKSNSNELYTGVVTDTSDVIITFEVVNGIKNGAFITFYHNGEYEKYGMIENDKNVGEWSYFYPSGQLESVGPFEDNKANGKWTFYYEDGNIKMEGTYINGEQQGKWNYYDKEGNLSNIFTFQDGELVDNQIRS